VGQMSGETHQLVIPRSTILIENPAAIVDVYVDKHGTRTVAEAFLDFLFSSAAQEIYARHGLRSPDPQVAQATADLYPPVEDLFTIEYYGGWSQATPKMFADDGIYSLTVAKVQGLAP
jgi:sulfate/thiosulfate transport system substrate-binding protein